MKLIKLLILNILLSTQAIAEEVGRFSFLGEGQCALYEGALFDPPAISQLIITVEDVQTDCDIRMEYEIDLLSTEHAYEVEKFLIEYNTLNKKYLMLQSSTDARITGLEDKLKKYSPRNRWTWFVVGTAAGIATTYGFYRMFNEQRP
tara:strand:+ start:42332 stop:42772 length:441 start_codon:yes stop_codon:yes gene_type:complete